MSSSGMTAPATATELEFLGSALAKGRSEAARWRAEADALDAELDIIESALLGTNQSHLT